MELDFRRCGYPERMIKNIFAQVKNTERNLKKKECNDLQEKEDAVMVISTYGSDKKLTGIVKNIEKHSDELKFRYVKNTGPSLRNILIKPKVSALGQPLGDTTPCEKALCKACTMMSGKNCVFDRRKKKHRTAKGKCNSKNLIYHARCRHCSKVYVGKTTQALNSRIYGHQGKFSECVNNYGHLPYDDDHLLGLHLYHKHQLGHRDDFDGGYEFTILENCSPKSLDLKEHKWVQKLQCVAPYGLNSHDPFGIPILL